jgi:hypothetical protein
MESLYVASKISRLAVGMISDSWAAERTILEACKRTERQRFYRLVRGYGEGRRFADWFHRSHPTCTMSPTTIAIAASSTATTRSSMTAALMGWRRSWRSLDAARSRLAPHQRRRRKNKRHKLNSKWAAMRFYKRDTDAFRSNSVRRSILATTNQTSAPRATRNGRHSTSKMPSSRKTRKPVIGASCRSPIP